MKSIIFVSALIALSARKLAHAQQLSTTSDTPASLVTSISSTDVLESLSSIAAAMAVSSYPSSYSPSSVPFNSGPDPFPIVLPSTVIRTSTYSSMTADATSTADQLSTDPFSIENPTEVHTDSSTEFGSSTTATSIPTSHLVPSHTSENITPTMSGSSGAEETTKLPATTSHSAADSMKKLAKTANPYSDIIQWALVELFATIIVMELLM